MTADPVRIVLADDQAMIRAGLALVLGSEPGLEIVAELPDGAGVADVVATLQPDLVLLDIRMPTVSGPEATRILRTMPDSPPVLALTTFDDDEVLWSALDAGVMGFILKDSSPELLIEAVRAVAGGGAWIDPRVLPRVLARARGTTTTSRVQTGLLTMLTPREAEVLRLICTGASNKDIAVQLHVAERTVKSHVSAIFSKLGARDRAGAVVAAFEAGLDPRDPPR
jgi:DNA-binding NarL/FixJ family response regulator